MRRGGTLARAEGHKAPSAEEPPARPCQFTAPEASRGAHLDELGQDPDLDNLELHASSEGFDALRLILWEIIICLGCNCPVCVFVYIFVDL